jgi:hypothetical protein
MKYGQRHLTDPDFLDEFFSTIDRHRQAALARERLRRHGVAARLSVVLNHKETGRFDPAATEHRASKPTQNSVISETP